MTDTDAVRRQFEELESRMSNASGRDFDKHDDLCMTYVSNLMQTKWIRYAAGRAAAERDREDAKRYRFLRNLPIKNDRNIGGDIHFMFAVSRPEPNQWCIDSKRGDDMDAAIDAATKGEKTNG